MVEVHFTITRNKTGWFVNEFVNRLPRQTHGPYPDPINEVQAMDIIYTVRQLTQ